ncbi:MAG: hypothetical protein H7228_14780 [Polaromonas sp.]|nr:hypothetical protein [Polaromonas sp.]
MIYAKTEFGQTAFKTRSIALTPGQRAAFILFDGKRDSGEVLKSTAGMGVTLADLDQLVISGMLVVSAASPVAAPIPDTATGPKSAAVLSQTPDGQPTVNAQAHYSKAYPIATRLTAGLGLRGFRLNLAVEAAGDLDKLKELAPKIREAVGPEKFLELENALYY